ncbi:MAG: hypothetical protein SFY70_03825 [Bacteroidia bacterium]|nr:hypothetical protein [Bacteroidia bacterium]
MLLLLLGLALPGAGWAQGGGDRPREPDPNRFNKPRPWDEPVDTVAFRDKQLAMQRLIAKQLPHLDALEQRLKGYAAGLGALDSILSYRAAGAVYQDSALRVMVRVRSFLKQVELEVKAMHFEWLPLQRELMAVHAKYGELWAIGRLDPSLKETIEAYRALYSRLQLLLAYREYLYNESEFLLNAKLD